MKNDRTLLTCILLVIVMLTSCSFPGFNESLPTQAPIPATTEQPIPAVTPTMLTINLSGPPMEVGSTYPYVDGTVLVAVPGGEFIMGHGNVDNIEHKVFVSDIWIYSTKVTNQQYTRCVEVGKCVPPDLKDNQGYTDPSRANDPVSGVNYDQASAYCDFVHGRLPTEAEWEKVARGPDGNIYPWGNAAPSCDLLNFNNCVGKTTNVVDYLNGRSYYGALDMAGNAFEWVADWFDPLYYKTGPLQDPPGPDTGDRRSIRSSSYKTPLEQVVSSARFYSIPGDHRRDLGFRCAVKDPTYFAPFCVQNGVVANSGGIDVTCSNLNISVQPLKCDSNQTIVTFNSDDPKATFQGVDSCTSISGGPGNFPAKYLCTQAGNAGMDGTCTYSGVGNLTCPSNYTLDQKSGTCKWSGGASLGANCPEGFAYDPAGQCCAATSKDFPLCQAGSSPAQISRGQYACVGGKVNAIQTYPHEDAVIAMPGTCPPPGSAGGCSLTDKQCNQRNVCPYGGAVDLQSCTCVCNPG